MELTELGVCVVVSTHPVSSMAKGKLIKASEGGGRKIEALSDLV